MTVLIFVGLFIVVCGALRFILNYSHLLNSLLRLEIISVSIFFLIGLRIIRLGIEIFYLLYFMVILVCEGVLGLSLLIVISYSYGRDRIQRFNSLVC